jgi:hypothetical protein
MNTYRTKFLSLLSEALASPQWHSFKGESCGADCLGYNGWAPTCCCGAHRCQMTPQGDYESMTLVVEEVTKLTKKYF